MARYRGILILEDGRRLGQGEVEVPVGTKVIDVRDGKFDTGGPGDWFYLQRLTEPTGTWVWQHVFTPPDMGGFEQKTRKELSNHFGWTVRL